LRYASIWILIGALVFACVISLIVVSMIWAMRPEPAPLSAATAVLEIIYVPTSSNTPVASSQPTVTPTVDPDPASPQSDIVVGSYVQIEGTGGDGLRLRSLPGLEGDILLIGVEAEVFQVDDGPTEMDGYIWWHLIGPYDETHQGWAASTYLSVVQNP